MCQSRPFLSTYTTRGKLDDVEQRRSIHGGPSPGVSTFKSYKEDGFGNSGRPVLVESKRQRDALCAEHHLTYDRYSTVTTPNTPPAIDSIDWGDVKHAVEHGISESKTQLDLPLAEGECSSSE